MKYIRTKNGRIVAVPKNSELVLYDDEKLIIDTTKRGQTCVYGIVEKQADTIEELCDEFVFHTLDGYEQHFLSQGHLEDVLSNNNIDLQDYLSCREIYGAIWTDNGLTYVARMNEKGELELL